MAIGYKHAMPPHPASLAPVPAESSFIDSAAATPQKSVLRTLPGSTTAQENSPRTLARERAVAISVGRGWFLFAIGSLVLAGLLSLTLVVGRIPGLGVIFTDPLFFKRALVVHVDLALVVWFQAGAAAFLGLAFGGAMSRRAVGLAFALGGAGVAGMLAGALMPGAQPVLANYVPVIDHPVFLTGLAAWFAGTGIFFTAVLLMPAARARHLPDDAVVALRVAAAGNLIALATFLVAWRTTLTGLPPIGYYELVMWGGGHALQAANVAAMLGLWLLLLHRWSGREVLSPSASRWLLSVLVAPHAALPFLALGGTSTPAYIETATQLMRWTLFPVITIVLGLSVRHVALHRRDGDSASRDYRLVGLAGSAALIVLGLILGAFIRGSNTLVPGHYHAAIGAVTLALMTAAYEFCALTSAADAVQRALRGAKLQLLTFGVGQAVFAVGFGLAGVYGLGRKQYGAEQHVRTLGEYLGLGVMGVGGILAVAGGLLFLAAMLRCAASWRARTATQVS